MLNPEERRHWLVRITDGRRLNKPLVGEHAPDLSISNVAFREAPAAFSVGLFVSTVLTSYTACEIFLTERYTRARDMTKAGFPGTPEDWSARNQLADKRARAVRGIDDLLEGLVEVGQWIRPTLAARLRSLSSNRNDLAHYRPIINEVISVEGKDGAIVASFTPSHLLDPVRQEGIAMESLATMFDLWDAPVVGFTPGHPPEPDWEPPQISDD